MLKLLQYCNYKIIVMQIKLMLLLLLKMTGIKLELMLDVDQYQFIEKGMRGRISYIAII